MAMSQPEKTPWYVWYCLLLGFLWNCLLFLFLSTTFAEKLKTGFVITGWTLIFSLALYIYCIRCYRKNRLRGKAARAVMRWGGIGLTLFVAFLFIPFNLNPSPALSGRNHLRRLDSREQAGSSLYVQAEGVLPDDEITLTIFDICLGGISNKTRRDGPINPEKMDIKDISVLTSYIKNQAAGLKAGLVGITRLDQAHVFTANHKGQTINLPHEYAIVLGVDLPYQLALPSAPLPWREFYTSLPEEIAAILADKTPMSGTDVVPPEELEKIKETMRFFSEGGRSAVELARHIRSLGYEARAHYSRWSEVQIIPLAQSAGLGELGRNGLLLTQKYGPRASFSVVTTNMPLVVDKPVDLGLQAFCTSCEKCAYACPVKAVPLGAPKEERGVVKWVTDGQRCFDYLLGNPKCLACIGSCPFNKPDLLLHRVATYMATRNNIITNNILLLLDNFLGYGDMQPYQPDRPA
ncbi:MAG: 4Fe-4S dicluster domain-containing protein [Desulfovibrio sp.]|nr:4Fe-4S dicluster domain-containing protein [Desulfovibrio sp.]